MSAPRVVVVGAGIVGAACARALALAGARVVVCAKSVAGGATAAGMGHLVVMDDSEAQFALCRYSQGLWDELATSLPAEGEFLRCGTLWVAADEEEMAEVERKRAFYAERGIAAHVLDERGLAEEEPNLRRGLAGGLVLPTDSVIYPPVAARFLLDEAVRHGAEVRLGVPVTALDGRRATLADGTRVEGDVTVNAAGAMAPALTPGLPVRPRKGHLVITDRYPAFMRHQIIELGYLKNAHHSEADSVAFNVQPRLTGQLLLGSSRQFDCDTSAIDHGILGRMVERALEYVPGLARLSAIRAWTGLRAATPDSLPLIGRHAGEPGPYLATGHEGLGITTSLGTAELLADLVLGRPTAIPSAPYSPSRFEVARHAG